MELPKSLGSTAPYVLTAMLGSLKIVFTCHAALPRNFVARLLNIYRCASLPKMEQQAMPYTMFLWQVSRSCTTPLRLKFDIPASAKREGASDHMQKVFQEPQECGSMFYVPPQLAST